MTDRPEQHDPKVVAGKECNWLGENIWGPLSDFWNTKTTNVNPNKFLGMPDSITVPQLTTCDHSTGKLITEKLTQ